MGSTINVKTNAANVTIKTNNYTVGGVQSIGNNSKTNSVSANKNQTYQTNFPTTSPATSNKSSSSNGLNIGKIEYKVPNVISIFEDIVSDTNTGTVKTKAENVSKPQPKEETKPKEETQKVEKHPSEESKKTEQPQEQTKPKEEAKAETKETNQNDNKTENKEKSKKSSNDLSTPAHTKGEYLSGKSSSDGYGPEFLNKVKRIAADHDMNYKELLALMNSESGINSKCDNGVGYVGLMQWGSDAASQMGTTKSQLKNMTPIEQLDYVDKSLTLMEDGGFVPKHGATAADYYAANFLPYRAKNGDVLTNKNEGYYRQNKGLDVNKDGYITKSDLDQRMKNCYVDEASFTNN